MGMPTLPDVPETDYRDYLSQQFSQDANQQIDSITAPPPAPPPEVLPSDESTPAPAPTPTPSPASNSPSAPPEFISVDQAAAPSSPTPLTTTATPPDTGFRSAGAPPPDFIPSASSGPTPLLTTAAPPDTGFRSTPPPDFISAAPSAAPSSSQEPVPPGGDLQAYARQAAQRAGIDPDIFVRQIQQESGFNPGAKSGAGALGIAQFMPGTAAGMGIDPTDPYAALDAAAKLDAQNLSRYQGDYSKALAAYNAGPGAVDKYGGVPPFEETNRYVNNILQGQNAQAPITPSESLGRIGGWAQPTADRVSQFNDPQLTTDEAYSACGPAAAVRFAQAYGRNPTLREAVDLAKSVGWTSAQGMAGISSEQQLLSKMGIPTKLTNDMSAMAKEAQTGNPVTISTPGHYFYADGYDPGTGAFHVGRSGTDLKGGSEWMTPAQMEAVMGKIQGGLLADNPTVPQDSTAQNVANQVGGFFSNVGSTVPQAAQPVTSTIQRVTQPVTSAISDAIGGAGALGDQAVTALDNAVASAQQAGAEARANQASQLPGGAFNRLAPGSEGGPPDYTNFGQAAAASGPTSPTAQPIVDAASHISLTPRYDAGPVDNALEQLKTDVPALAPVITWYQNQQQQGRDTLRAAGIDPDSGVFSSKPEIDPLGTLTTAPQQILSGPQQGNWGLGGTAGGILGLAGLLTAGQTPAGESGAAARAAEAGLQAFESRFPPEVAHAAELTPEQIAANVFGAGGATPTTGATQLKRAMDMLSSYPEEVAAPIRDFASTIEAPSSQIASTIMRWVQDNPLHTMPDVTQPAAAVREVGQQAVADLADSIRTGGSRGPYLPPGEMPGQLGLLPDHPTQPIMPEGAGGAGVPSAATSPGAAQWLRDLQTAVNQRDLASVQSALEDAGLVGDRASEVSGVLPGFAEGVQRALQEGTGGPGVPSARLGAQTVQWLQDLRQAAAQRDFAGIQDVLDRAGLTGTRTGRQGMLPGFAPAEVTDIGRLAARGAEAARSATGGLPEAAAGQGGLLDQMLLEAAHAAQFGRDLPRGVTQDMVDLAHAKIDNLTNAAGERVYAPLGTHAQLTDLLQQGATPAEIARFFAGLTGDKPGIVDWMRALRTGSMAGGLSTEGKVLLGPLIQTAMRGPAGALHAIMRGRPGDIPAGLRGGISGLAEGAQEALQTIRYGTNYRAALTGGAQGGYGFRPGASVIGTNPFQRALGTVLEGLVRTHGAVGDISAGIGRGANRALGATPEQALEAGQQWAFRSGEYGAIGSRLASMFDALRSRNPAFDAVSQIILPFYRVGYNVFTQGVEHSPVGLAGRVTDAMQGKPFDRQKLANNLFGVGLAAIAFKEAGDGNITGEHPEGGAPKQSVRIGGQWMPLRVLGPLSEPLAQAALTYESARDSRGDTAKFAEQLASSYVKHVDDETWLSSLHDALDTMSAVGNLSSSNASTSSRAESDLNYLLKSYGKSFIPQEKLGEQVLGLPKLLGAGSGSSGGGRPPGVLPVYKPGGTGVGSLPVYKPSSFPKAGAGR